MKRGVNVRGKQKERAETKPEQTMPEAQGEFLGIPCNDKEQTPPSNPLGWLLNLLWVRKRQLDIRRNFSIVKPT
jgi:hypothetical protein